MVYNEPCNSLFRKRSCLKSIPKNAITSFSVATQPRRKDKGSNVYPLLLWQFTIPLELPLYSGRGGVTRCDSSVAAARKPGTAGPESLWLCGLTFIRGNVISSVTRLIPGISCSGGQTDTQCQLMSTATSSSPQERSPAQTEAEGSVQFANLYFK